MFNTETECLNEKQTRTVKILMIIQKNLFYFLSEYFPHETYEYE